MSSSVSIDIGDTIVCAGGRAGADEHAGGDRSGVVWTLAVISAIRRRSRRFRVAKLLTAVAG